MMERVFNFHAGPGALPAEVLQQAAAEMMNYRDTGMGVMELSHRSDAYNRLHQDARQRLRKLLAIPATHDVLFLQGGAGHQFVMIPANFAKGGWPRCRYRHLGQQCDAAGEFVRRDLQSDGCERGRVPHDSHGFPCERRHVLRAYYVE